MRSARKLLNIFLSASLLMVVSCQEKTVPGSITLESDEILVSDNGAPVEVRFTSTSEWRLEYNLENGWLSTDLMGGRPSTGKFSVRASANKGESLRFLKLRLFTLDGKDSKEITVVQLSSYPSIVPESYSLVLPAADAIFKLALTANVEDDAISARCDADWISNIRIEERVLLFDVSENSGTSARSCVLVLESRDGYGRVGEAVIKVSQAAPSKYNSASIVDIATAGAYPAGKVTDNVCVEGYVVVNGTSKNYETNRYILVDDSGNSIVLESKDMIAMSQNCKARVALMDTYVTSYKEGEYSYKVFTDMTITHLLKTEDSEYHAPVTTIGALSDANLFSVVTLSDVEVALPAGAYTNFKTCWPGNETQKAYDFFVKSFPFYYRYYPIPVRDRNGDSMYMLTALKAPWAHTTLPAGSGSITGVVVRVKLPCFDIKEDVRCIIPLSESDIALDQNSNDVSVLIAEWDCNAKLTNPANAVSAIVDMDKYNPDGGLLKGNAATVLNKSGNTKFARVYSDNVLGYQDSFRGDVNLSDADDGWYGTVSSGYYGRVNGGAFNSRPWDVNQYFYIDGISTKDISGSLSLQVIMNITNGKTTFVIEYADGVGSSSWTKVEGSEFDLYGQLDRSDSGRQTESNFPGYKFFTFALPDALLGKDNVCIRLRSVSSTAWQPVRLDHISLKYNK